MPTDALRADQSPVGIPIPVLDNELSPTGKRPPRVAVNYVLTEEKQNSAPFGSSLGWLIPIDGDNRRNEFINAACKRRGSCRFDSGHELEALDWLAQAKVEGVGGLGMPYPMQPGDPVSAKENSGGGSASSGGRIASVKYGYKEYVSN